ncbi:phage tail protein I [Vibrio fluvialis]|nr:phage tail protein I [Vibrio fluvialis]
MSSDDKTLDYQTLLPTNRTPFERAFEEGIKELANTPELYSWLHDPSKTDAALLDMMAQEEGVLDWFFDDSEASKRESILKSKEIMRLSGTRGGIKSALKALGVESEVKKGNLRYHLMVEGFLSDQPMSSEMSRRINSRINSYRSERDSVSLTMTRSHGMNKNRALVIGVTKVVQVSPAGFDFLDVAKRTEQCSLLGFEE